MEEERHINIMLVEDNPAGAILFSRQMDAHNVSFTVHHHLSGDDLLTFIESTKIDTAIIVVDINMPGIDGHETVRRIRALEKYATTPIIMLTSSRLPKDVKKACEVGANGYIVKGEYIEIYGLLSLIDLVKAAPETFLDMSTSDKHLPDK